ncbi:HupE/UreJ family protein [Catenovulum maritimum]|uniref:HupE/UreJ family protein n=1 Tax=Catenovulum maritimum TaxID=1513271 RepID=UPI000660EF03|nr:HupE/UreJ family protein [Catenovulum maritimum]
MKRILPYLMYLTLLIFTSQVSAHEAGVTDTQVELGKTQVKLTLTLPNKLLVGDISQDNAIKNNLIQSFFKVNNQSQTCIVNRIVQKALDNINSTQYHLLFQCPTALDQVKLTYHLSESLTNDHKNYLTIKIAGRTQVITLDRLNNQHQIPVKKLIDLWQIELIDNNFEPNNQNLAEQNSFWSEISRVWSATSHYFFIGIEHIIFGYDHLLFLLALILLPSSIRHLVLTITFFTIAHSLTLALSLFELVSVPIWLVESFIAASIIFVALENIKRLNKYSDIQQPSYYNNRLRISFVFGLIHGLGFSFILKEMGLTQDLVPSLIFFNLGVETGQVALVILFIPLLYALHKSKKCSVLLQISSLILVFIGSFWLIQRIN